MSDECNFLGSVSSQQKFEAMDVKALSMSQLLDSLCYTSQTDHIYLENKEEYILEAWGHTDPKDVKRREREGGERERERERETCRPFGSSLYMFFPSLLGLLYVNWARQECCLFYLRSLLQSLDFPLTFLCSIF